jgi:hypothetical protein
MVRPKFAGVLKVRSYLAKKKKNTSLIIVDLIQAHELSYLHSPRSQRHLADYSHPVPGTG